MEVTLRDIVYVGMYVVTVTIMYARSESRVKAVEKSMGKANDVIFKERGGLNLVTIEDCEKRQASLRQHSQDALNQIGVLNQNVVAIMIDMNLKPIPMKPETLTK